MKRFVLLICLVLSAVAAHADTFSSATNVLNISSVQLGLATYSNVRVDLGADYQVIAAQVSALSNPPPAITDIYDAAENLLTIPLVTVDGRSYYQNVEIRLGAAFRVTSVGGCRGSGCSAPTPANVAPLVVDNGPISLLSLGQQAGATNVPFTTVTICEPGTHNCQNFDHILVDTGSMGFRVISSQLSSALHLPAVSYGGSPVYECLQYVSSINWGTVNLADVKIAGKVAANIPIQVIDAGVRSSIPRSCLSSGGVVTNTVDSFGANGILGIGNLEYDCGALCATGHPIAGTYYSCIGTYCRSISLPLTQQVPNPVTRFSGDSNGSVIRLPAVPAAGATNVEGQLIFGIGTAGNNGLGGAQVVTLDSNMLNANYNAFTTVYKGQTLTGFVDSGSNALYFYDSSIAQCGGLLSGQFCPPSTLTLSATNYGLEGIQTTIGFSIANADTLTQNNPQATAFVNFGAASAPDGHFDWGLPFFFGRTVYTGIESASSNPYIAY